MSQMPKCRRAGSNATTAQPSNPPFVEGAWAAQRPPVREISFGQDGLSTTCLGKLLEVGDKQRHQQALLLVSSPPRACVMSGNLAKKEERNGVRELQSLEKVRVGVDCAACRILSADKISTGPSEITETNTLEHSNDDLENGGAAGTMVFGKDGP
ncbi:hypothetical protein QC762_0042360 [Podospora pseudocomata]|uniref:Uncharacterized protein n=1 Tax=Podospora pseudocomata TaxID=2093779 RepID=A0ABR0GMX3_9PEZI|nr:hypothetical protein QC762_0042360 [Podospora pseudocomata]